MSLCIWTHSRLCVKGRLHKLRIFDAMLIFVVKAEERFLCFRRWFFEIFLIIFSPRHLLLCFTNLVKRSSLSALKQPMFRCHTHPGHNCNLHHGSPIFKPEFVIFFFFLQRYDLKYSTTARKSAIESSYRLIEHRFFSDSPVSSTKKMLLT